MNVKTDPLFAVTTILDRSGRRVGSYLVDRSQDALNRDKKQQKSKKDSTDTEDEAVIFHASEIRETDKTRPAEPIEATDPHPLDLTV
jgi:hypothetical protein